MNRYPKTLFVSVVLEALVLLTAQSVFSQTWSNRFSFSNDTNTFCVFNSIDQVNENQILISGSEIFAGFGIPTSLYLIDENGDLINQAYHGIFGEGRFTGWHGATAVLPDNEFLLAGGYRYYLDEEGNPLPEDEVETEGYLAKWNTNDLTLEDEWFYPQPTGFCTIRQLHTEDSIMIAGQIRTSSYEGHAWIASLDDEYNINFEIDLRDEFSEQYSDVGTLAKSNDLYLIGGYTRSSQNETVAFLYTLTSEGILSNLESYLPDGNYIECSNILVQDGHIYISLIELLTIDDNQVEYPKIVCLNESFELQWHTSIIDSSVSRSSALALIPGNNGSIVTAGVIIGTELSSLSGGYLTSLSSTGEVLWTRTIENSVNGLNNFWGATNLSNNKFGFVGYCLDVPGDPFPGQQDAWVTVTDEFGCVISGCEVSVPELLKLSELSVYPNPASSNITIEFSDNDFSKGTLEIYSITGALVHSQIINQSRIELSVRDWDKGLYIIQMKTSQGVVRKKVIVE